ncbi:hypothetical protein BD779DRAFT_1556360, partial [Infundibulicybe gibba]
ISRSCMPRAAGYGSKLQSRSMSQSTPAPILPQTKSVGSPRLLQSLTPLGHSRILSRMVTQGSVGGVVTHRNFSTAEPHSDIEMLKERVYAIERQVASNKMLKERISAIERQLALNEVLKKRTSDIDQPITTSEQRAFDRLVLQCLIREAQMGLAVELGLAPKFGESAAKAWDDYMPQGSIKQRIAAITALIQSKPNPRPGLIQLLTDPGMMRQLVDPESI